MLDRENDTADRLKDPSVMSGYGVRVLQGTDRERRYREHLAENGRQPAPLRRGHCGTIHVEAGESFAIGTYGGIDPRRA